jgi:putative intracellular protease/amidase
MEKLVAGICTGMAILAAVRYTHFRMAVHAADVIRCFQPHLISMKQGIVSINFVKIFSFEPFA